MKQKAWDAFGEWCRARGLSPSPAHPWTLAAYIRFLEQTTRLDKIRRLVTQIGQVHYEKLHKRPDRDPMVKRTLEAVRRSAENAKKPKPPPLFRADDFLDDAPPEAPPETAAEPTGQDKETRPGRRLRKAPKLVRRKRV